MVKIDVPFDLAANTCPICATTFALLTLAIEDRDGPFTTYGAYSYQYNDKPAFCPYCGWPEPHAGIRHPLGLPYPVGKAVAEGVTIGKVPWCCDGFYHDVIAGILRKQHHVIDWETKVESMSRWEREKEVEDG